MLAGLGQARQGKLYLVPTAFCWIVYSRTTTLPREHHCLVEERAETETTLLLGLARKTCAIGKTQTWETEHAWDCKGPSHHFPGREHQHRVDSINRDPLQVSHPGSTEG